MGLAGGTNRGLPPEHRILRPSEGVAVVEIFGEHDVATHAEIEQVFVNLVDGNELVVVDVSEAAFIDSTFLRALVQAHKRAEQRRSRFRVQLGPAPMVRKVFEISKLLNYLDCVSDREAALRREPGVSAL